MKPQKTVTLPGKSRLSDEDVKDFGNKAETVTQKKEPSKKPVNKRKVKTKAPVARVKRDSFTMPEEDYELIQKTINRLMKSGVLPNKGEVLRAGLKALNAMPVNELKQVAEEVEKIKTGRPVE